MVSWWVFAFALSALGGLAAPAEDGEDYICEVPDGYTLAQLRQVSKRNCDNVERAIDDFDRAIKEEKEMSESQKDIWKTKKRIAAWDCLRVKHKLENETASQKDLAWAAFEAVNSWGSTIMDGRECCNLLEAPYCVDQEPTVAVVAAVVPFAFLLFVFCCSILGSLFVPKKEQAKREVILADPDEEPPAEAKGGWSWWFGGSWSSEGSEIRKLQAELKARWLEKSCLRALPGAGEAADSASSLFAELCNTFRFQPDSVRNQFEHVLSLWRSQCAMVADRFVETGDDVVESRLLGTALGDLHAELLDGFLAWRKKLQACDRARLPPRKGAEVPPLAGLNWKGFPTAIVDDNAGRDEQEQLSTKLAEISTFLLVWAEAGNVRFMPEVLYFITELALAAAPPSAERPLDKSLGFLAGIIRPIYNSVFEEWYDKVSVNGGKDAKKLHDGYENYLPANVANYDDWNELFCDPQRLVAGIQLIDGKALFDLDHKDRFAALKDVDWDISLLAAATKTHREVHSLWGVFASTQRIWLVHAVLFFLAFVLVAGEPPATLKGTQPLLGRSLPVRLAAVSLLVPVHALLWWTARWQVTGAAKRPTWGKRLKILCGAWACQYFADFCCQRSCCRRLKMLICRPPELIVALLPIATYGGVRYMDEGSHEIDTMLLGMLGAHLVVSLFGLTHLLLVPRDSFKLWELSPVRTRNRVLRYTFWLCIFAAKFSLALIILGVENDVLRDLRLARIGQQTPQEILALALTAQWWGNLLVWFVVMLTSFLLFFADTQMWFTIACTVLGLATIFKQRGNNAHNFFFEDAMAKIPLRFSRKVLSFASYGEKKGKEKQEFASSFPFVWDRIIAYMRYEDDIDSHTMSDLVFDTSGARDRVLWEDLQVPVGLRRAKPAGEGAGQGSSSRSVRVKLPGAFRRKNPSETAFRTYCCMPDANIAVNSNVAWRFLALARGLALPMPRPYRAPYFPGITVLIPHYGEQILIQKKDLFREDDKNVVPLMHWLKKKYQDEFVNFSSRMLSRNIDWPIAGDQWDEYSDAQWERVSSWASMRMQTLWRTVAGLCYYHPALQCHFDAQADRSSSLAQEGVWNPSDCFTCLVSMQMYKFFDGVQLEHTNRLLEKFPSCLKVAFIDNEPRGPRGNRDLVHPAQERRYFSCLIDRDCAEDANGRRSPVFRIELPGFPILGDGKGDNQNHAIPFMRGHFSQCIDANQGAYFEQMMLLPCALGEFRSRSRGDGLSKRIIGFPEHITSDIGSIGDFAASAEVAFGTILQRSYAVLGARMHYGHPDIMNKLAMMQQGGVSKATKTINLSEDIFAGMDFTLRGGARQIRHREYFHLAKGRDMGFNAVLGFFSKLSSGTGEQLLSRQTFRLGQVLHLPEALSFYYAHAGYYLTQWFISVSMPLLIFTWLLVLLSDCEGTFDAFQNCQHSEGESSATPIMARFLSACFSWLVLFFLVASTLPLFCELWVESNFKTALLKFLTSMSTLAPLMFIFQAKTVGYYMVNEVRHGGASYVATGRGLPTERRPIIGRNGKGAYEGLFLDYAAIAYYDGVMLLLGCVLVHFAGGRPSDDQVETKTQLAWVWLSAALTITSWLYAPFIFNPYNFSAKHFKADMRAMYSFFFMRSGKNWNAWFEQTVMAKKRRGVRRTMLDVGFFCSLFFLTAWYQTLNLKAEALTTVFSEREDYKLLHAGILLPPLCGSLAYCTLVVLMEKLAGCPTVARRGLAQAQHWAEARAAEAARAGDSAAAREAARQQREQADQDSEDENGGKDLEAAPADAVAARPTLTRSRTVLWEDGLPLAISAILVTALDICEAVFGLFFFYWLGWNKAFLAGLLLKWGLTGMCLSLVESMLRSKRCVCGLTLPLHHWVRAHRMARDMFVSLIISLPQIPFVMLNSLNDYVCPGCSAHQLLIYRDPGTVAREEKVFDLDGDLGVPSAPEVHVMGSPKRGPPREEESVSVPVPMPEAPAPEPAPAPVAVATPKRTPSSWRQRAHTLPDEPSPPTAPAPQPTRSSPASMLDWMVSPRAAEEGAAEAK